MRTRRIRRKKNIERKRKRHMYVCEYIPYKIVILSNKEVIGKLTVTSS